MCFAGVTVALGSAVSSAAAFLQNLENASLVVQNGPNMTVTPMCASSVALVYTEHKLAQKLSHIEYADSKWSL